MFKNKNKEANNSSALPASTSGASNTIAAGTNIEGTIKATNDIRIDGSLKGRLECKGRVIIGKQGSVTGDIVCQNAVIEGSFSGNLKVIEILNVKESAKIEADIETGQLHIHPGAVYNGNCSMGGQKLKSNNLKTVQAV